MLCSNRKKLIYIAKYQLMVHLKITYSVMHMRVNIHVFNCILYMYICEYKLYITMNTCRLFYTLANLHILISVAFNLKRIHISPTFL